MAHEDTCMRINALLLSAMRCSSSVSLSTAACELETVVTGFSTRPNQK
jgi:hypothetical protein